MKTNEQYIGCLEIETPSGDFNVWEVVRRNDLLLVGTGCNTGLLVSYSMTIEPDETLVHALEECLSDLEVEARDGARYMSRLA